MIHTIELYTTISYKERELVEHRYGKDIRDVLNQIMLSYPQVVLRIHQTKFRTSYNIYLYTDVIELLKRSNGIILSEDWSSIQHIIEEIAYEIFGHNQYQFTLCRIDYRLDLVVESNQHRDYLFKLWNKLAIKYSHLKKRNSKKEYGAIDGKIRCKKKEKYKTTLYFSSQALSVCVYDKQAERIAKKQPIKKYEENVIRFVVRLRTRHLAYNLRQKKITRNLETYFKTEMYKQYVKKYIVDIFGKGNFYKINAVRKLLIGKGIKKQEQENIIAFLKAISKKGVEGSIGYRPTSKSKEGYSRYLIKKYRNLLDDMRVNIILLPMKWPNTESVLINPLSKVDLEI